MIIDLRNDRSPAPVRGKNKIKCVNGQPVIRRPEDIDAIVLHQTACDFGAKKGEPRYRRALDVACHALTFKTGETVLAAPLLWYVNHGNGFNPRSLGFEVEGHYPGIPGRGPGTDVFTPEHRAAFREGFKALVRLAESAGIRLRYLWAHRQSSATRRADPGFEIWQEAEDLAFALGLRTLPNLVIGSGRPIPGAWRVRTPAPEPY
jgi:hypothetical protein